MNSFNLMEIQEVADFNSDPKSDRMYTELEAKLSTMRFLGAVFNMYLPIMADTIVNITGGGSSQPTAAYPEPNENLPKLDKPSGPNPIDNEPIR